MPYEQTTITLQQAIELALEKHRAGNLVEAENLYRQVLQVDPNHIAAIHMLGVIASQVGKFELSADLLEKTITLAPKLAEAHGNMGLTQFKLGNYAKSIEYCEQALKLQPDYFDAYANLGNALLASGKLEAAIVKYKQALSIRPQSADIQNRIGISLRSLARHDEAVDHFQSAIDQQPDYSDAYNNLGNTLRDMGRRDEAISNYQLAYASNPAMTIALHNHGATLQELKRYEEAADVLKKSNHSLSYANLLECLYILGKQDDFYTELKAIAKKDDVNVGVAAIGAFAAHQFDTPDPYPFCDNPMEFACLSQIVPPTDDGKSFLNSLRDQILSLNLEGGNQSLLQFGFQSSPSLFSEPVGPLLKLEQLLRAEIETYFSSRHSDNTLFVTKRPERYSLLAWYIIMEKGGELSWHHHPSGWLSGSFYIDVPTAKGDEAAIEFALHGNDLPTIRQDRPTKLCNVSAGDLVLFPSSLFHRTVAFSTDETRLCVAFDLMPIEPS